MKKKKKKKKKKKTSNDKQLEEEEDEEKEEEEEEQQTPLRSAALTFMAFNSSSASLPSILPSSVAMGNVVDFDKLLHIPWPEEQTNSNVELNLVSRSCCKHCHINSFLTITWSFQLC